MMVFGGKRMGKQKSGEGIMRIEESFSQGVGVELQFFVEDEGLARATLHRIGDLSASTFGPLGSSPGTRETSILERSAVIQPLGFNFQELLLPAIFFMAKKLTKLLPCPQSHWPPTH